MTDGLRLRRVRVNDGSEPAQADPRGQGHTDFADHFAGVTRHDGCPKDFIPPLSDVELHEPVLLTVQNSAVHFFELPDVGVHF